MGHDGGSFGFSFVARCAPGTHSAERGRNVGGYPFGRGPAAESRVAQSMDLSQVAATRAWPRSCSTQSTPLLDRTSERWPRTRPGFDADLGGKVRGPCQSPRSCRDAAPGVVVATPRSVGRLVRRASQCGRSRRPFAAPGTSKRKLVPISPRTLELRGTRSVGTPRA